MGGRHEVSLPAEAGSAARARRHVRHVLGHLLGHLLGGAAPGGSALVEAVVADAEVCVSELVTNAVLHAGTPLAVGVRLRGPDGGDGGRGPAGGDGQPAVRLEVRDGSAVPPQWVPRSLTASTGRGLALITALSAARGVEVRAGGKTVWCELSLTPRPAADLEGPDTLDAVQSVLAQEWSSVVAELQGEPSPAPDPPAPGPAGSAAADAEPIHLVGYPVELGVRMREHREAVLRELRLLTLTHAIADSATAALAAGIAELLSAEYAGHLSSASQLVLQALVDGEPSVDLHYPRLRDHQDLVEQWRRGLHDLERLSTGTALAPLTTPADVGRLGEWVLEEFTRQLEGRRPRPWSGTAG